MVYEKYMDKSLDELEMVRKQQWKQCVQLGIVGCLNPLVLNNFAPNDLELLISVSGIIVANYIKKIIKALSFEKNYQIYYCHSKEFQDAKKVYNLFLEELIKMFQKLNWSNEMKVFSGYSYLLKQGYLSLPHEFFYSINTENAWHLLGSNIILGEGNCKHINSMLSDLLRTMGYLVHNIGMKLDKKIIHFNEMPVQIKSSPNNTNTQQQTSYETMDYRLFTFLKKHINSRHLATLFTGEDTSYIMDALNHTIFVIDSQGKIYQNNQFFSFNKKYSSKFNSDEKEKIKKRLTPTDTETLKNSIINDYYGVWNTCEDYHETFEKFHQEHKELYEEIIARRKILIDKTRRNYYI